MAGTRGISPGQLVSVTQMNTTLFAKDNDRTFQLCLEDIKYPDEKSTKLKR